MKRYGFLASCVILAVGIMWSNLAVAKCPPKKDCLDPFVLAKRASASEPICFEQFDCRTIGCDVCNLHMIWRLTINSKDPICDEAKAFIPDGSTLLVDIHYRVRPVGPCNTPVGTHEGKFKIFDPAGNLIGTGTMKGTNGLETHVDAGTTGECCNPFHDEGCMEGILLKGPQGTQGKWTLRATYSSSLDPAGNDVCKQDFWKFWNLNIDGIVLCKWIPPTTTRPTTTTTKTTTTTRRTITITIPTTFPTIITQ